MSREVQVKNYNYCKETLALKSSLEVGFIALGERLHKIREEELYKPSWDSFPEFLHELKISESVASRIITVYKKMVLEYGFTRERIASAGGWDKAYQIVKLSSSKEEAEEFLDKAEVLHPADFSRELKEKRTGVLMSKCSHDWYEIRICKNCGEREKVHDE